MGVVDLMASGMDWPGFGLNDDRLILQIIASYLGISIMEGGELLIWPPKGPYLIFITKGYLYVFCWASRDSHVSQGRWFEMIYACSQGSSIKEGRKDLRQRNACD